MRKVALDVLDFDRGVVHQDADGERQSAKGHDVDGFAQRAQAKDAHQNRKRNGDGDDQRAAPVSQEQQDHHRRQARRDQTLREARLDGGAHEQRLIEERA